MRVTSVKTSSTVISKLKFLLRDPILSDLAHPVNHAFSSMRHRLILFRQKFGQNREVLHWILRSFRVGLNIDNVGWRMSGKILLEGAPGARQDPATRIQTGDRSAENATRQWKGCDVATGRRPVRVEGDCRILTPDANHAVRGHDGRDTCRD